MESVNQQYDDAIQNIIKVYLAQMNSAMEISKKKDKILVGSDGDYIAVCRKCFLN